MKLRIIATIATLTAVPALLVATALALTPLTGVASSPYQPVPMQATGTITGTVGSTSTATSAAASATIEMTGTVTATAVVTGTGTPVTATTPYPTVPIPANVYVPGGQGDFRFADPAFQRVWSRTDRPVAENKVARTWFWGPGPNTPGLLEEYRDAPSPSNLQRLIQYFDKSRMEINNPNLDATQPFFVTNGLLTVELISGFIQVGEKDFIQFRPACIPMTGDFGDTLAPTYFTFQSVSNTQAGDHPATNRTGQNATETIDRNGTVGTDPSKAGVKGVEFVHYENQHNIPKIFWDFLNSSGPVYDASAKLVNEQLIQPWFYASGLPISEPYWTTARVRGTVTDVMVQAYERRSLTYVPTNEQGFQVEMGNIGQHYFDWRYRNYGLCPGVVPGTPTPPVPVGSPTAGTGTPTANAGTPTARAGTPEATATATPVAGTPQPIPITPTPEPTKSPSPVGTPIP